MKTIWVLGAGASIGHTNGKFPTINQFFSKAKELQIINNLNGKMNNKFKNINNYIKNIFGKNIIKENLKLDIEEILTYLEIDIEKNSSLELNNIKYNIVLLIRNLLDKLTLDMNIKEGEYDIFKKELLKKSDTIITFNWDLLLDNVLERENILPKVPSEGINGETKNQFFNLIMDLTSHREGTLGGLGPKRPYINSQSNKGYYLKLHGSVDWLYCSNKSCRSYAKVYPSFNYMKKNYCAECHEEMDYLLIPPVLNKQYNMYPFIRTIWNKAAKEIEQAERIIIWGYSLPPTDFYSNWLLRQARGSIKELTIINPETKYGEPKLINWNRKFIDKFIDLYKPKISFSSVNIYENFKDFYKKNKLKQKYNLSDY